MTTPQEVLLKTLKELGDEDFGNFKWFLNQEEVLEGFKSIPWSRLEKTNRFNTVGEMVQIYGPTNAIKVTEKVLMKMDKTELVRKISGSIKEPAGASSVKLETKTADTEPGPSEPDPKRMKTPIIFTPEMQTESAQISYRFSCPVPGVFQCAETGMVFVMTQGAELQYRIVQWNESRLKPTGKEAAGPLVSIQCSEDAAVLQIHFPHCETKDALSIDGLLSVAHFTNDEVGDHDDMDVLEPLRITDTHVVVAVPHLSYFGLIRDAFKRLHSLSVKGQVVMVLRPPRILDTFLLQKNIPVSQVAPQQRNAEYIKFSANCSFTIGERYSLRCEQESLTIQPEHANLSSHFGPHFQQTFTAVPTANPNLVTLIIQNQEGTEIWKRDIHLTDPERNREERVQPERVQPQDWMQPVWTQLINGLTEPNVNQLVNILYQQGVFNVQERNIIRAQIANEKASKLIEWVQQKGPDAVSRLKTALRDVDPSLSRTLNLL